MQDNRVTGLVSVVICARDREKLIEATLRSVALNHPGEIIVIDDGSKDRTAEVARRFTELVQRSAGTGLAAARQLGAEIARGRYVAYVDSDVVLDEGCLEALARVLESDATIGGVQPMIEVQQGTSYWGRSEQSRRELNPARMVGDRETFGCTATMFRRELILEHRFDPFFVGAGEDIDFSRRLRAAGWRLYRTDARAWHRSRESLIGFIKQRFWYGRGAVRLSMRSTSPNQTALPPQPHVHEPHTQRALLGGGIRMLPFFLLSGAAFHLGRGVEWLAQIGSRGKQSGRL